MALVSQCWCGNASLEPFSSEYVRCPICDTIVLSDWPDPLALKVKNDSEDFYGAKYFESYVRDRGYPSLMDRARTDLPERCLHWLKALLAYKLPPSKTLELGSAHGGFVALQKWAGFDAIGLEMSPTVVQNAKKTFDVSLLTGPVEDQNLEPESFDVISLMDVLEHFASPTSTMAECLKLLKPDGILLIQTPRYPGNKTFNDLRESGDQFLLQLKPEEHIFLFSESSAKELFGRLGAPYLNFEPAIFAHYDMFFAVSRSPLKKHSMQAIESSLTIVPSGRLVQSMFDQDLKLKEMGSRLDSAVGDREHWRELYYKLQEANKSSSNLGS